MSEGQETRRRSKLGTVVCIILIILLLPILIFNVTMVVKGMLDEKNPPSVFGIIPLAVLSGSMDDGSEDCIRIGDMIFVRKTDVNALEAGDIITFSIGDDYITHRIVEVQQEDGVVTGFITKGDANNTTDGVIPVENVYGKYFYRVPNLGNFAIFLQTPVGILVFVGIPFIAYILIDVSQHLAENRRISSKKGKNGIEQAATVPAEAVRTDSLAEKEAEIERLRTLLELKEKDAEIMRLRALLEDQSASAAKPEPERNALPAEEISEAKEIAEGTSKETAAEVAETAAEEGLAEATEEGAEPTEELPTVSAILSAEEPAEGASKEAAAEVAEAAAEEGLAEATEEEAEPTKELPTVSAILSVEELAEGASKETDAEEILKEAEAEVAETAAEEELAEEAVEEEAESMEELPTVSAILSAEEPAEGASKEAAAEVAEAVTEEGLEGAAEEATAEGASAEAIAEEETVSFESGTEGAQVRPPEE